MRVLNIVFLFAMLAAAPASFADFGEIQILVEDSITAHFQENGYSVDLSKLEFNGPPKAEGDMLRVRTSVWGEQGMTRSGWGWHDCETLISVAAPGQFADKGSECYFDFD